MEVILRPTIQKPGKSLQLFTLSLKNRLVKLFDKKQIGNNSNFFANPNRKMSTMKITICILTISLLTSCGKSNEEEKTTTVSGKSIEIISDTISRGGIHVNKESELEYRKQSLSSFEKVTLYNLKDTIITDFNGDGILDKAFYKKENEISGSVIKHGNTKEEFRIGFGMNFAFWPDFDCNWVDYWGLVQDKETRETTFTEEGDVLGSREVKLPNPSLFLGADEVGGGLITFLNGKYQWIHQAS